MRNVDRAARTRQALTMAVRILFAAEGYVGAGTEAILARAGVMRGALYHHFQGEAMLFGAVCRDLQTEAAGEIARAVEGLADPHEIVVAGSLAWMDAIVRRKARRILCRNAPSVLGWERWMALDRESGGAELASAVALVIGPTRVEVVEAWTTLLNGALNAAIMEAGEDADSVLRLRA